MFFAFAGQPSLDFKESSAGLQSIYVFI